MIIPQGRARRRTVEQVADVPVHQVVEETNQTTRIIPQERVRQRTVQQVLDVPVPQVAQEIVGIAKILFQESVQQPAVELVVDLPAPKVVEELVDSKERKEKEEDQTPKMNPPDHDAFNEKIQEIQKEIEKLQTQQSAITAKINERYRGKEDFFQKKAEIRAELDAVSARMDEIRGKNEEIQKAIGDSQQQAKDMRKELNSMKKSIGFTSGAEIDERIAAIEFKLWTESIPLKDEKKLLAEIQDLKKSKSKVLHMSQMGGKLTGSEAAATLKKQNKALNETLAGLRKQKREIQARLAEMNDAWKAHLRDTPQLIEVRESISGKIREKVQERNQVRDESGEAKRELAKWQAKPQVIAQERIVEGPETLQQELPEHVPEFQRAV